MINHGNDKMIIRLLEHKRSAKGLIHDEDKKFATLKKRYKHISNEDIHRTEAEAIQRGYLMIITREEAKSKKQQLEPQSPHYGQCITITQAGLTALTSGELSSETKKKYVEKWVNRRSWIAIGISIAALIVSILIYLKR